MKVTRTFKLIGLNKPWKAGGFNHIYATVEQGKEDWFHSRFDEKLFPDDRLEALFGMFNNSAENLWHGKNHKVAIKIESGDPVIKELILDGINAAKS